MFQFLRNLLQPNPRRFLCVCSAHGSSPRFNFSNPEGVLNKKIRKTQEEAAKELDAWIGYGCTCGADGVVLDIPAFIKKNPGWREHFPFIEKPRPTVGETLARYGSPLVEVRNV